MQFTLNPDTKVTLGTTAYINEKALNLAVRRLECGFDTATVELTDYLSDLYPSVVTTGTAIQIDVKDKQETSYPTIPMFKGVVRFPSLPHSEQGETVVLKCDGSGYGLGDTVCGTDYGLQSVHRTTNDNITEILTDATYGLVPKYVNHILASANDSGFNYDTANIDTITGAIPYIDFPYKPNDKCINDLCDLVTAIKDGGAGPHWIVGTDDKIRLKLINGTQTGWTKYYGNTVTDSTLIEGVDFLESNFEHMGKESNYVIYYGNWRRPSSGDAYTSLGADDLWGEENGGFADTTVSDDGVNYIVNSYSLKINLDSQNLPPDMYATAFYPKTGELAWNLNFWPSDLATRLQIVPTLNFNLRRTNTVFSYISLYLYTIQGVNWGAFTRDLLTTMTTGATWYHFTFPLGNYFRYVEEWKNFVWSTDVAGGIAPNWNEIDRIGITFMAAADDFVNVDGLFVGNVPITRIAREKYPGEGGTLGQSTNPVKMKLITDEVGKDDSLLASDDSGTMAQMAYSELLRLQKEAIVGPITVPMIKDALPGQWFHVHAKKTSAGTYNIDKDMRAVKVSHAMSDAGFFTTLDLTDDLANSRTRPRYEDINKQFASVRPEFQDRQATSMKAGQVDTRTLVFEKYY